jgi:hypothetical protein
MAQKHRVEFDWLAYALWSKGICVTDHPDGSSSSVPCWTSRLEYEALHRARWPGTLPVSWPSHSVRRISPESQGDKPRTTEKIVR